MFSRTLHLSSALFAVALLAGCGGGGPTDQMAATSATAPPGGVSSTTAPSNSQGTPAGGTGDVSTTSTGAPMAAEPTAHPRHMRHHRRMTHRRHARPMPASTEVNPSSTAPNNNDEKVPSGTIGTGTNTAPTTR